MSVHAASRANKGQPIVFFHGDKGGVGKSFACTAFVDSLVQRNISVAIVDGDPRNPDVERMFSGGLPAVVANLRKQEGWMDLIDYMMEYSDLPIIVSLPAGIGGDFQREAPAFFQTAEIMNRPVAMFWVINRLIDSVNLLNQTLDTVGDKLSTKAVVKNLFFGSEDKFSRWDNSLVRKRFESLGGITLELPELHARVIDKLFADNLKVVPFSEAVVPISEAAKSPFQLSPSENLELTRWLRSIASSFAPLQKALAL